MSRQVAIRAEAEAEMVEAAAWYAERHPRLAAEFIAEFRATLARLAQNPFQYQAIDMEIRRAPLDRYPYRLLYAITDDDIQILSCIHGRRDPARWRERLKR